MSETAIEVSNLSKRYRLGLKEEVHDTLAGALLDFVKKPADNLRRLRRLTRFQNDHHEPEDVLWALRDVSFDVKRGVVLGIIGRNGAGKSTLLKILSRITHPTSGRIELKGRVSSLLEVGTGFHQELTGRENVYLNGTILGMRKVEIDRKFDEIVAFSGVEKFIDTPVKRYSSGMRVRLAFSVAAHLEPEILLIDEVLAVGDADFQKKCLGRMDDVAREGRTVLFVSHNMIALQSLCLRAIWLENGIIREDGPANKIVPAYLQSSTDQFSQNEQVWQDLERAPGNEMIRLHRVNIRPENDDDGNLITRETPTRIELDYWNLVPDAVLHITLHFVYAEQGIVAFSSSSAVDPYWNGRRLSDGLFRSVCHVPGNLLNSGQYSLHFLAVHDLSRVIFRQKDLAAFLVVDTTERKGGWFGREPGVVQPDIPWSTTQLSTLNAKNGAISNE